MALGSTEVADGRETGQRCSKVGVGGNGLDRQTDGQIGWEVDRQMRCVEWMVQTESCWDGGVVDVVDVVGHEDGDLGVLKMEGSGV